MNRRSFFGSLMAGVAGGVACAFQGVGCSPLPASGPERLLDCIPPSLPDVPTTWTTNTCGFEMPVWEWTINYNPVTINGR